MPRTVPATQLLLSTLEDAWRGLGLSGRSVLLAVSGGADSTALLVGTARLREALGLRVEVASLDHGLRPESVHEVESVARLAAEHGLPFHTRALHLRPGVGMEARARQARYEALESLRAEAGLEAVATAHTASDQAETLLMRLVRGTSLKGARGIHPVRGRVVRPLLGCTREEVEAFLAEQGLPFLSDPMNVDPALLRVRIRREVLPALERAAGHPVARRLASFTKLAAEDEALLEELAGDAWSRLVLPQGGLDAVGVRALRPPLRRRVLARLVQQAGAPVDEALLSRLLRALETGRPATLGRGLQLRSAGGRVRCVRPEVTPREAPAAVELAGPGASVTQPGTGWRFEVRAGLAPPGVQVLPLPEDVPWPLTIRARQPGDRVRGKAGTRRLQDVFVDARVPAERRQGFPVVVDARGTLLWVPGLWAPAPPGNVSGHSLWATPPSASGREGSLL